MWERQCSLVQPLSHAVWRSRRCCHDWSRTTDISCRFYYQHNCNNNNNNNNNISDNIATITRRFTLENFARWKGANVFNTMNVASFFASSLVFSHRGYAAVPSVEDVHNAYKVLGIRQNCTYADIKKRYVDLAKEHHPDVVTAKLNTAVREGSNNNNCHVNSNNSNNKNNVNEQTHNAAKANEKMVEINNAYSTVRQFHKSGQSLPSPVTSSSSSGTTQTWPWSCEAENVYDGAANDANFDCFYNNFAFGDNEWNEEMHSPYETVYYTNYSKHHKNKYGVNKKNYSHYNDNSTNNKHYNSNNSWSNSFHHEKSSKYNNKSNNNNNNNQKYYHDGYAPWHEDLDPLMYELMWEDMRRQCEENAEKVERERETTSQKHYNNVNSAQEENNNNHSSDNNNEQDSNNKSDGAKRQTRNPENNKNNNNNNDNNNNNKVETRNDIEALIHMYSDGKSFEFIANALSRTTTEVVAEFNKLNTQDSHSHKRSRYSHKVHPANSEHLYKSNHYNSDPDDFFNGPYYYYAESPDDIPIDLMGYVANMNHFSSKHNNRNKSKSFNNYSYNSNSTNNINSSYNNKSNYYNNYNEDNENGDGDNYDTNNDDDYDDDEYFDEEDAMYENMYGEGDNDPYGYAVGEDDFMTFNKSKPNEFVPYNSAMPYNGRVYMSGGAPSHTHHHGNNYKQTFSARSQRHNKNNNENINSKKKRSRYKFNQKQYCHKNNINNSNNRRREHQQHYHNSNNGNKRDEKLERA